MDRLSFVSSLLLIVSVTATLGSVIKAKNPNGEELEALLKRSHDAQAKLKGEKSSRDEDSEMSKQIVSLRATGRQITIDLENESTYKWEHPSIYLFSGTTDGTLPDPVETGNAVKFKAHGNPNSATGTVGVFTYYIQSIDQTLAVMWSVPYSNWYENWWNAKLYGGFEVANYEKYYDLYYGTPNPVGPDEQHEIDLDSGLKAVGNMTSSSIATLNIEVTKVEETSTRA